MDGLVGNILACTFGIFITGTILKMVKENSNRKKISFIFLVILILFSFSFKITGIYQMLFAGIFTGIVTNLFFKN